MSYVSVYCFAPWSHPAQLVPAMFPFRVPFTDYPAVYFSPLSFPACCLVVRPGRCVFFSCVLLVVPSAVSQCLNV